MDKTRFLGIHVFVLRLGAGSINQVVDIEDIPAGRRRDSRESDR